MSAEIACKKNILVTDFHLLKLLLVVLGFGSQTNVCGFSRQNICSVEKIFYRFSVPWWPCNIVSDSNLQYSGNLSDANILECAINRDSLLLATLWLFHEQTYQLYPCKRL